MIKPPQHLTVMATVLTCIFTAFCLCLVEVRSLLGKDQKCSLEFFSRNIWVQKPASDCPETTLVFHVVRRAIIHI